MPKRIKNKSKTSSLLKPSYNTKKVGLAPGTLVYTGDVTSQHSEIDIFYYSSSEIKEKKIENFSNCLEFVKNKDHITWINIEGINNIEVIKGLGSEFKISNLVLEDVMNINQRAKYEDFYNYKCIFLKMLSYNDDLKQVEIEHVSFIFSDTYLITLQEGKEGDVFTPVRERIRTENSSIRRKGTDYLLFALLDIIVDNYFVILEKIGEEMESLDFDLINNPTPRTLESIYDLKREIIYVRKSMWPLREIISKLERDETNFFKDTTKPYIRDLYDHIVQVIDNVETYRDIISGMMDLYLSSTSNKMNEVMKVLTMISTIFIPLTFVAGIYGMNFDDMPELKMKLGYPITLAIMLVTAIFMIFYFKRKKWFTN